MAAKKNVPKKQRSKKKAASKTEKVKPKQSTAPFEEQVGDRPTAPRAFPGFPNTEEGRPDDDHPKDDHPEDGPGDR